MEEKHPFPENYVMFHHRVGRFRQKLRFPTKGECLLIVTHGFVVRELCWRMNQIPDYSAEIKYCGFAAFKHDGKK
jgi:broad specificity phosphatase PhoE